MQSGDGLIVRVHAGSGWLSSQNIRDLTRFAAQYGNGQLELTRRANLQLRGVREAGLAALQAALVEHGLAQPSAELEARAALVVDPLCELDPACAPLTGLAARLRDALLRAPGPMRLPSKFGVVVEGGSAALDDVAAEIRLRVERTSADRVWLYVAGSAHDARVLGVCREADAPAALLALVSSVADGTPMRDAIARAGLDSLRSRLSPWLLADESPPARPAAAARLIGFCAARDASASQGYVGLGLAFGSADVELWNTLADLADTHGRGQLRATASRSLLVPVSAERAADLLARAAAAGCITDAQDPLLRAIACPGAPACSAAAGETRALARRLVQVARPLFDAHTSLHVSGCGKSCALTGSASFSVVHSAAGVHLGFDCDVAAATAQPAQPLAAIERRFAALARAPVAASAPVGVG